MLSISAGTALAQAEYVEPSRGQIPADRALDSIPAGTASAQAEQAEPSRGQILAERALDSIPTGTALAQAEQTEPSRAHTLFLKYTTKFQQREARFFRSEASYQ